MGMQSSSRQFKGAMVLLFICLVVCSSLPVVLFAEEDTLSFAESGLSITNQHGFLSYWREHDGSRLLGTPVTAELTENGITVQYFERGRLESHQDLEGSPVIPGRVGAEYAEALWQIFSPPPPHTPTAGEHLFAETGFSLSEPFLSFWNNNGALETFGYPISEPFWNYVGDKMAQMQYFERGRLEYYSHAQGTPDAIKISPLGRELALLRGYKLNLPAPTAGATTATPRATSTNAEQSIQTTEEEQEQAEEVQEKDEKEFDPILDPLLAPFGTSPSAEDAQWEVSFSPITTTKSIVVSISRQWLYAYDGDTLVFDAPISTGMYGYDTPTGNFFVYAKTPLQTMEGTLNGEHYKVVNVTHAMYIHNDVAIHGTYWHNDFGSGTRRSHGCINLPRQSAAWLFGWTPVGTLVQVTY